MPTDPPEDDTLPLEELDIPQLWPSETPEAGRISEHMLQITRPILARLEPDEQGRLADWLRALTALRDAPLTPTEKPTAIAREMAALPKQLLPVLKSMGTAMAGTVKAHAWDNRTWSFRIGGGITAIAAATLGGKKAGLAMLGTAVAIPAWVVYGAGGVFAGMVIDELECLMAQARDGARGKPEDTAPPRWPPPANPLPPAPDPPSLPGPSPHQLRQLPPAPSPPLLAGGAPEDLEPPEEEAPNTDEGSGDSPGPQTLG
jgi:hypothetical protein